MSVSNLIDKINNDEFSDAREELNFFITDNISSRVKEKQLEFGFVIPEIKEESIVNKED